MRWPNLGVCQCGRAFIICGLWKIMYFDDRGALGTHQRIAFVLGGSGILSCLLLFSRPAWRVPLPRLPRHSLESNGAVPAR